MSREQIGIALGYKDPKRSIELIHNSHKDRLDKFSTTEFASVVEGLISNATFKDKSA